jgi:protoheme ferro-lyase
VTQGDYNLLDLRLSLQLGKFEVTGFLENLTDERGVTSATHLAWQPLRSYLVRPRTAGVTVDYRF